MRKIKNGKCYQQERRTEWQPVLYFVILCIQRECARQWLLSEPSMRLKYQWGNARVSSMLYELFHALLQRCHYPCLCRLDSWLTQSLWCKGKALTPTRPQWDGCSAHGWGLAEVDVTENSCDATLVVGRTHLLSPSHNLGNSGACNGGRWHWVESTDQASSLTALLRWNAGLQRRVTPTTATIDWSTIPGIYIQCLI